MPPKRYAHSQALALDNVSSVRVRDVLAPRIEPDQIPAALSEISTRQWAALLEVLLEAKFKAEALLRNDQIYDCPGRVAHYQGWLAYCDYIISSLENLRATTQADPESNAELHPGPESL